MWTNFNIIKEKNTFANILSGDLRISILSNCNMQCVYCHSEGSKSEHKLSVADTVFIVERALPYGVKQLRITGGEPLLHPEITEICRAIKKQFPKLNIGINTNGILIEKIKELIEKDLVDRIVVGIDLFASRVSKNSPTGEPSQKILKNIEFIKRSRCTVEVDAVYNDDYYNILCLAQWCLKKKIRIKILELINDEHANTPSASYVDMIKNLAKDLALKIGINNAFGDLFGEYKNNTEISFFHSLCRTKECFKCARMHMRVTSDGYARPCLKNNKTIYPLLDGNFDNNMRKAIYSQGTPPEL